jgi:hypothetical protein
MPDGQGKRCQLHDPKFRFVQWIWGRRFGRQRYIVCFRDEERDRLAGVHRCSSLDDGFGGYLCVCLKARFSPKYGCMNPETWGEGKLNVQ